MHEISLETAEKIPNSIFISLEFDRIIRQQNFATDHLYNIHFSMLPKYRGVYTSVMPILNNEKYSGVTFHNIDHGIDTGDIIAQKKFPIDFTDTAQDLYLKYLKHGTELVKKMIDHLLADDKIESIPQNPLEASYYSRSVIDYNDLQIDLKKSVVEIYNQWRAFYFPEYQIPKIHGYSIFGAKITDKRSSEKPGTIVEKTDCKISIATIDYDLDLIITTSS